VDRHALREDIRKSVEGNAWHGPSVSDTLQGVSAVEAAWRPPGEAHSISELTLHIAAWMEEVADRLEGNYHQQPIAGDFPNAAGELSERDWEFARQRLEETLVRLCAVIDAFPEERLTVEADQV